MVLYNLYSEKVSDLVNLFIPQIPLTMDPEGMVGPKNPIKLKLVTRSVECN